MADGGHAIAIVKANSTGANVHATATRGQEPVYFIGIAFALVHRIAFTLAIHQRCLIIMRAGSCQA